MRSPTTHGDDKAVYDAYFRSLTKPPKPSTWVEGKKQALTDSIEKTRKERDEEQTPGRDEMAQKMDAFNEHLRELAEEFEIRRRINRAQNL